MVRATLDRQYRDAVMQSAGLLATSGLGVLPVEVAEFGDAVIVRLTLNGIRLDQLEVTVDRQSLSVRIDSQSEAVELPAAVQVADVLALYRHGVLSLILRKASPRTPRSPTDTVTPQPEQSFPASDAPTWLPRGGVDP
jgi:HSP20 family molecular chaperone IbpA